MHSDYRGRAGRPATTAMVPRLLPQWTLSIRYWHGCCGVVGGLCRVSGRREATQALPHDLLQTLSLLIGSAAVPAPAQPSRTSMPLDLFTT
jgi:hypothetical protein